MKKLLSILATLAVGASSASAVVSCSAIPTQDVDQNGYPISHNGAGGTDSDDDFGPTAGSTVIDHQSKGDSTHKANPTQQLFNDPNMKVNMDEVGKIKKQVSKYAQKKILEDQYGINGNYLDSQLFKNKDGSIYNPEDGVVSDSTNLSNVGNYGKDDLPFLDYLNQIGLINNDVKNQITDQILPFIQQMGGTPTPSDIGSLVGSVMPFISFLQGTIQGAVKDPASIKKQADEILNPLVQSITNDVIDHKSNLDKKYYNLSIGDTAKAALIGAAYLFAYGTGDTVKAQKFANMDNVSVFDDASGDHTTADGSITDEDGAATYLAKKIGMLTNTPKLTSINKLDLSGKTMSLGGNHLNALDTNGNPFNPHFNMTDASKYFVRDVADDEAGDIDSSIRFTNASWKDSDQDGVNLTFDVNGTVKDGSYLLCYFPGNEAKQAATANKEIQIQFTIKDGKVVMDGDKPKYDVWGQAALGFNKDLLKNSIAVTTLSDIIQLVSLHLEAFVPYELESGQDADHVFKDPKTGKPMGNYQAVTQVRNKKVSDFVDKDGNIKLNILKTISDVSWYIGKLNDKSGMYRAQALLDILFLDDDRSVARSGSDNKFLLTSTPNDTTWDGGQDKEWNNVVDSESSNMAPLTKVGIDFANIFIPLNEPQAIKGKTDKLLAKAGLSWNDITGVIEHDGYMILQSLVWNRGLKFSEVAIGKGLQHMVTPKFSRIDTGYSLHLPGIINIDWPGLQAIPEWNKVEDNGILNYLFNGDLYKFVDQIYKSDDFKKFFGQLDSFKSGLSATINNGLDSLESLLDPESTNGRGSETVVMSDPNTNNYNEISFKTATGETELGTDFSRSNPGLDSDWTSGIAPGFPENASGKTQIKKVIANNNSNGGTTLYLYATDVLDKDVKGTNKHTHGNENHMSFTPQDFAKRIHVGTSDNANAYTVVSVPDDDIVVEQSGLSDHARNCVLRVDIAQQLTDSQLANLKVSGEAYRYRGYNSFFATYEYYGHAVINEIGANRGWVKDDLDLRDTQNFQDLLTWGNVIDTSHVNLINTTFNITADDLAGKYKGFTVYGVNPGKGPKDKNGNATDQYVELKNSVYKHMEKQAVNVQEMANNALSWVLGLAGVPGFNSQISPLGLPIAEKNSTQDIILKFGQLLNEGNPGNGVLESLTSDLDFKNFKNLSDVIFGTNGQGTIVDRIVDALTASGDDFVNKLNDALGTIPNVTGQYRKSGIIGALIAAFTPSAIGATDPNSGIVVGTQVKGTTPLWDYAFSRLNQAWTDVNDTQNEHDVQALATGMEVLDNNVFETAKVDEEDAKGDKKFNTIQFDINYDFTWAGYWKGNAKLQEKKATYTITVTNVNPKPDSSDQQLHFKITRK